MSVDIMKDGSNIYYYIEPEGRVIIDEGESYVFSVCEPAGVTANYTSKILVKSLNFNETILVESRHEVFEDRISVMGILDKKLIEHDIMVVRVSHLLYLFTIMGLFVLCIKFWNHKK